MSQPLGEDSAAQSGATWREQKTRNAQYLEDELRRRRKRESDQARALLAEFIVTATARGIAPVQLFARSFTGRSRYKTNVLGWYLKADESLAVDTGGEFYILSVDNSLMARFVGTAIAPSAPPLVLGAGGRDGESIDLVEAIDRILHPEKY